MLNIHILTLNNADTLPRCLDSIESVLPPSFYKIVVGDGGSTDGTKELCVRRDIEVVSVDASTDVSKARNSLLRGEWQFYLEPWEALVSGGDHLYHAVAGNGSHIRFNVIQGDVLDKPVRLWKKSQAGFVGQVYERVGLDGGQVVGAIAAGTPTTAQRNGKIVSAWCESSPAAPEPFYYRACEALGSKQFQEFQKHAAYYNFVVQGKPVTQHTIMLWYYQGMTDCFVNRQPERAIQRAVTCLAARPLMAEFWCLLGDVHYHLLNRFDKAAHFYENAIVMGSRRRGDDDWPVEISKYQEYPEKMAASCRQIIGASEQLGQVAYRQ